MSTYKLGKNVVYLGDLQIPLAKGNSDYIRYLKWLDEGNTPEILEEPPEPQEPNWLGFNSTFLSDPNWISIASQFSTPDIRIGIVSNAAGGNAPSLQLAYGLAVADLQAQGISLDQVVLESWQGIADTNHIPVNFL